MEITNDRLTSKTGPPIFAEYNRSIGLTELSDKYLASPKNNRGFKPSVFVNSLVMKKIMEKEDITEYALDIDATEIIAEKQECSYTYKNNKGYMPMLGFYSKTASACTHIKITYFFKIKK